MFFIDFQSRTPVFEQIVGQVENFVLTGILQPGDKLPSIRELTATLGVNPNTIQKAYNELDKSGIIVSASGRGCFISRTVYDVLKKRAENKLPEFISHAAMLYRSGISKQVLIDAINQAVDEPEKDQ